jgi:Glycosyltransferase
LRRVVFVNRYFHPDHSATSQLLTDVAIDLARRGWDVSVMTSRQSYEDPGARLAKSEDVSGVKVRRIWSSRFGRSNLAGRAFDYVTFYFSAFFALLRTASRDTIVVAETDPPLLSVPAAFAVILRQSILVNWLQDLFPEVAEELHVIRKHGFVAEQLRSLRNFSLRIARTNVVLGRLMQAKVRRRGGRTTLRPNWADGSAIRPIPREANEHRKQLGLSSHFVVGYSGNLGRAHEWVSLLDAMIMLEEDDRVRFVFTGSGASYERLQRKSERYGLKNVIFRPYQPREELAESLAMPDVHLVTLRPELEGLIVPSKFYGVAAAGRPTIMIGSEDGEIGSIVRENDCGIVVPQGEVEILADTIRQLAGDRERVERMGANARALFESQFDAPIALAAWDEILMRATEPLPEGEEEIEPEETRKIGRASCRERV